MLVGFHIIGFQSCTPESLTENTTQGCCGDEIPPPPPPPPGGGGNGGG